MNFKDYFKNHIVIATVYGDIHNAEEIINGGKE